MKTMIVTLAVLLLACGLVAGCAPGDGTYQKDSPAGFFSGLWHGWIAPITLVVGLFNNAIRIYEVNNTGWWYDLGFYIAVVGGFGGIAFTRKRKSRKQ
jgi:polyferredoxin